MIGVWVERLAPRRAPEPKREEKWLPDTPAATTLEARFSSDPDDALPTMPELAPPVAHSPGVHYSPGSRYTPVAPDARDVPSNVDAKLKRAAQPRP